MNQTRNYSAGFDLPYSAADEPPTVRAVPHARPPQTPGSGRQSANLGIVFALASALAVMMVVVLSQGFRQHVLEVAMAHQKADVDAAAALQAQEAAWTEAARVADQAAKAEARIADEARRVEDEARQAKERAAQEAQRGRELQLSGLAGRMTGLQTELDAVTAESADYNSKVQAYMSRHSDACIALFAGAAGGSAAFSSDPTISEKAKVLGGLTAIAALAWAIDHQEEVNAVSSELSKASAQHESYASRIADLKDKIADVQGQIDGLKP